MHIHELFLRDVRRDIPPVVYFHQQGPAQVASEVGEYIITGGLPERHPRARQLKDGIHEQYVKLLTGIVREQRKPRGPELPAVWISGFYGSGKSIFAKLLGLSLDGLALPDGRSLAAALLDRDESPRAEEFRGAWRELLAVVDPIAVVFDVGGAARDREHVHNAVLRKVQERLGYCGESALVADYELRLEIDGFWPDFEAKAHEVLGRPWDEARREKLAEDHFSHVMCALSPDRYEEPMSWLDARAGTGAGQGMAVAEAVAAIEAMMAQRAQGKALFVVIDEVSQYVHQDGSRMLKLQSFVSELGQRLHGAVWLLATGQQKLEDEAEGTNLGKLKDRFPERLRVHLATTNIRDVVHKRLLQKRAEGVGELRALFHAHRPELQLHAYGCDAITEEDFVEVYPLLPGYVDLILDVTSELRRTSSRTQGDDYAVRGLLQLLGELFREQHLADREVGALVSLDAIHDILATAFDADRLESMRRVVAWCSGEHDPEGLALRAAKAVALLQLVQERKPTTAALVAQCLYDTVGQGNREPQVAAALERLRDVGHLGYSEKVGYKLQSSTGQDWDRERRDIPVVRNAIGALTRDALVRLMAGPNLPKHRGVGFAWRLLYSDGGPVQDERIQGRRGVPSVTVDFRDVDARERQQDLWVRRSKEEAFAQRLVWVLDRAGPVGECGRELSRSRTMVQRYEPRRPSLTTERQRLLLDEQARGEELERRLQQAVADAWYQGRMYFRGRVLQPRSHGGSFAVAIESAANAVLPELYPHFVSIAVSDRELRQLLAKEIRGPSSKFLSSHLGVLTQDAGHYVPKCEGEVPQRVLRFIEEGGCEGKTLLAHFIEPPYGYPPDMIRACVAGLLRGHHIAIHPERGGKITSVRDPDVEGLVLQDKPLRTARIVIAGDDSLTFRDRNKICRFFKQRLGVDVEHDNDAIADAVHDNFGGLRRDLSELESRLQRLPGRPEPSEALVKLARALEAGKRSRQVDDTLRAVKRHLNALLDGVQRLRVVRSELTDERIDRLNEAARARDHELRQLEAIDKVAAVSVQGKRVRAHLERERPWREIGEVAADVRAIVAAYRAERAALLGSHEAKAERARASIKGRNGFERLTGEQRNHVLLPIRGAQFVSTAEATSPALINMRERFPTRLNEAIEEANDRLDRLLDDDRGETVVRVATGLRGREVADVAQLDAVLGALRERVVGELEAGRRVRLT